MPFRVISPDGIPDRPAPYKTRGEAEQAKTEFIERFHHQGYYAAANGTRIPLDELQRLVEIEEIDTL